MEKAKIELTNDVGTVEAKITEWNLEYEIDTTLRHEEEKVNYDMDTGEQIKELFEELKSELEKDSEIWNRRNKENFQSIYYDLLRLEYDSGFSCHIPIPMLWRKLGLNGYTILVTMVDEQKDRGEDYYNCPICGSDSFFQGVCRMCQEQRRYDELPEDYEDYKEKKGKKKKQLFQEIQDLKYYSREKIKNVLDANGIETLEYVKGGKRRRF